MKRLSNNYDKIKVPHMRTLTASVNQIKAAGTPVYNLIYGEPDSKTPEAACKAAKNAIDLGYTKYTDPIGIRPLREKIVTQVNNENGTTFTWQNAAISTGAQQALFNSFFAILEKGDEVIVPIPSWNCYVDQIHLIGGQAVTIQTFEENNFILEIDKIEQSITDKTKAIVINSPANPTGSVYSEKEWKRLNQLVTKYDLYLIVDEIYNKIIFTPIYSGVLKYFKKNLERLIYINGISKTYGMTGWRIGYVLANKEIIAHIAILQGRTTVNPTTVAQHAALGALSDPYCRQIETYKEKKELVYTWIKENLDPNIVEPAGGFYIFPSIKKYIGKKYNNETISTAVDFCRILLNEFHVGIVPGEDFNGSGYIRISFAQGNTETLLTALERIRKFTSVIK